MRHRRKVLSSLCIGPALAVIWLVTSLCGYWPIAFGDLSGETLYAIPAPENAGLEDFPWPLHDLEPDPARLKVRPDDRARFRIDSKKPFRIELGQGSGHRGLNTTRIAGDGVVILHRLHHDHDGGVTTTFHLQRSGVSDLLTAIDETGLLEMDRAYDGGFMDGTQWILWIQQGANEKSVYFDNHFPEGIIRFSSRLDGILRANGLANAVWRPGRPGENGRHGDALWSKIR